MGRRKIEMRMVTDTNCRQVTFSKRRTGLFKKANELATLCGAEVAIVVFSPGGKPFSFGQPTVEAVADRVLPRGTTSRTRKLSARRTRAAAKATTAIAPRSEAATLTAELNELLMDLEEEKDIGDAMDEDIREARAKVGDVDELGLRGLKRMERSLRELRDVAGERVAEVDASSSLLMLAGDISGEPRSE